ncbi:MFS transporter [Azospirillum griseum]|uniref:MFS transporter n=1 Tax=Azospirillum griseum TaxID=2496639 RepID=A0A3S0I1D6_9PROT|nr:MFS transporter [Azospirillum griseum]RTR21059.1 MFS transporter [Azospirillum griseum]
MTAPATLEIRSFIDGRRMSARQWILTVLCFLIVLADGMDVAIMGFVAPSIIGEWGISRPAFGMVMGAAPIGLAVGAILAGSSSDWFGRRRVLLMSVLSFGVFTLLTAFTRDPMEMAILRFLTGLGLGAAMPNTTTLLSEYLPERSKSFLLATMFTGFNFGSALIGFVAAWLLPVHGWQSVLYFGAAVPLALFPLLCVALPESARYMVVRGVETDRIRAVLSRITGTDLSGFARFTLKEEAVAAKQPFAVLFTRAFALRTFTLWVTYFMGLLVIYLTTSWLPTMMKDAGMSIDRAANVTAMFQLGGTIGAVLVGLAMDRFGANRTIGAAYCLGGVALVFLGVGGLQSAWLALVVGIVGFCMSGAQTGLNAFAPGCYPTLARATGVSWMLGVGRLGSILGSSIGGLLLSFGWGFEGIFSALALPAVLAAGAILLNGLALRSVVTDDAGQPAQARG